jgi:hypothetical protein
MMNNVFSLVGDPYEYLKTKTQNKVRFTTYANLLFNTMLEMFDYEGLPDTIPKRFLETILHTTGEVFISKINDKLIASHGSLAGEVDEYGLGTKALAICPRGEAEGVRGIDIAYGINNDTASPDSLVYWIAHLLAETDKSIKTNVIYSRLLKIPKVSNEKDKAMFEEIIKKVMDGEAQAFASTNALDLELGAGTETFELTDANKIDKLPYLTQFFEDCLKRFYNFYGQPMQNQNKRAQSISDEIHGQDSVSFIIPLQMLKCRQALCEEVNRIFGTEISVDFSPVWKVELIGLINRDTNGNGIPDSVEKGSDSDVDNVRVAEEDNKAGEGSSGTETKPDGEISGQNGSEAENPETEENGDELTETIDNPEEAPDLPAMGLESADGAKSDVVELSEVAEALGVELDEIKRLLGKDGFENE